MTSVESAIIGLLFIIVIIEVIRLYLSLKSRTKKIIKKKRRF